MDYLRNYVTGHFQPEIWILDIICLLEVLDPELGLIYFVVLKPYCKDGSFAYNKPSFKDYFLRESQETFHCFEQCGF